MYLRTYLGRSCLTLVVTIVVAVRTRNLQGSKQQARVDPPAPRGPWNRGERAKLTSTYHEAYAAVHLVAGRVYLSLWGEKGCLEEGPGC